MISTKTIIKSYHEFLVALKGGINHPYLKTSSTLDLGDNPMKSSPKFNASIKGKVDDDVVINFMKHYGLARNNIENKIESGLIKGYQAKPYNKIQFLWKLPLNVKSAEVNDYDSFLGHNPELKTKNVGANLIYLEPNHVDREIQDNSLKNYGFNFHLNNESNPQKPKYLYVFKNLIDMLSFYEMYQNHFRNGLKHHTGGITFLSINLINDANQEINGFLNQQKVNSYQNIVLCPNNDNKSYHLIIKILGNVDNKSRIDILTPVSKAKSWNMILKDTKQGQYYPHSLNDIGTKQSALTWLKKYVIKNLDNLIKQVGLKGLRCFRKIIINYAKSQKIMINQGQDIQRNDPFVINSRPAFKWLLKHSHQNKDGNYLVNKIMNNKGLKYLPASQLFRLVNQYWQQHDKKGVQILTNRKLKQETKNNQRWFNKTLNKLTNKNLSRLIYAIYITQSVLVTRRKNHGNKNLKQLLSTKAHYYNELMLDIKHNNLHQYKISQHYLMHQYAELNNKYCILKMLSPNQIVKFASKYLGYYHQGLINYRDLITPREESYLDSKYIIHNNKIYNQTLAKLNNVNAKAVFTYLVDCQLSLQSNLPREIAKDIQSYYQHLNLELTPVNRELVDKTLRQMMLINLSSRMRHHLDVHAYNCLISQHQPQLLDIRKYLPSVRQNPKPLKYMNIYHRFAVAVGILKR